MNQGASTRPIRVLVAKPGLDGHDRGALIVAQGLRDAGMEVVYTGLRQTPEQIVAAAIQEDVDCIGLSSLSGAHMALFPAVMEALGKEGATDILVIGGGVIPADDARALQELGIAAVFTPGSTIAQMADYIRLHVRGHVSSAPFTPPEQIDHVGLAVTSIDQARALYTDFLGYSLVGFEDLPEQKIRVAFVETGATRLELIEPTHDDSSVARFIDKRGQGLHHIAYRVDDVAAWLMRAREAGLRLIDEQPRKGAHGTQVAFVHPQSTNGVLLEFCQVESIDQQ
ncbi:MAG: methylmalonyl-CoA epimerase [Firmicutes bacterium]|nr:methylmalonyl-CoA epimerase [Bacillota bacterium]